MIWGGIHPTLLPEQVIENPLVDAVCIGEGEISLREYLDKLERGKKSRVRGIWYKDNGRVIKSPLRPYIENLDSLPFPNWDYWEIEKYLKTETFFPGSLRVLASRGCPFSCTFCANPALKRAVPGKWYRIRNPKYVIEEIKINKEKYWKRGLRLIYISDEIFGLNKKQFIEFCKLYVKEGLHEELPWECQSRADIITESWSREAARAGCVLVNLGVETGDDYVRNQIYKKGQTTAQIRLAVKRLKKNNIMYKFSMMFGGPWETAKSAQKSINLIKELNPIYVDLIHYQPLPKTELGDLVGGGLGNEPFLNRRDAWLENFSKYLSGIESRNLRAEVLKYFRRGIKLRGLSFITDVIKYLLSVDGRRVIPLTDPHLTYNLVRNTVCKYYLEDWKERKKLIKEV
jgi:radical SAM superfamily enzyme YgiQ (UPF0313 family)